MERNSTSFIMEAPPRRPLTALRKTPRRFLVLTALLAGLATGCGSESNDTDFEAQFEDVWSTFDEIYPYFLHKTIDWPRTHDEFLPRARQATSQGELVEVVKDMLGTLHDVHVTIQAPSGATIPTYIPNVPINWNRTVWQAYQSRYGWQEAEALTGSMLIREIPYIAISSWSPGVSPGGFDSLLERFRDSPGLILDVRMNRGGDDRLAFDIAGRFVRRRTVATFIRFRDGPQHDDFTDPQEKAVSPRGSWQFDRPVVVLVGRGCFSSNETFIAGMRQAPQVTLIGETTGGGTGNPASHSMGSGWKYTVSRWIETTTDGIVIEDNGIPADIQVPATAADFRSGRDPVLDFAVEWLAQRVR